MVEVLIRFGIPALAILLALGLSAFMFKRKVLLQKWHGLLGIGVSVAMMFFTIGFLQKTPFVDLAVMMAAAILAICSFAVFRAAERREAEREAGAQSGHDKGRP